MPIELPTDLTPELVPLSWLIGTWEGAGRLGEGEGDDAHFVQRVEFTHDSTPYLSYRAESWLSDEEGNKLRPLATEQGYWGLDRPLEDADGGPGLIPGDIVPALRTADGVEALRAPEGGFNIVVNIAHPRGVCELYYGNINGPRIELATDMVVRGSNSRDFSAATRMYGLVNGQLFWRWDVAAGGAALAAHASAALTKEA
ncbi:MAG: FABP family protein [Micrococcaceae bacterium]|uniref:FABP family protein n=1 Tax=Arthrobacter sp. AOP36-C1-22 TaxID=3457683 RepID=UPI00264ECB76|nr:FABP family protein [Micrococcaceae bacterium]MDN5823176.1 FABP family protein [Micrococcaceae bacterium]MDN5905569.1 FABP family protein [Micrococcaceae bacterium]MDN6332997.1 FABP family protein [Micrococcaceae bacterium]